MNIDNEDILKDILNIYNKGLLQNKNEFISTILLKVLDDIEYNTDLYNELEEIAQSGNKVADNLYEKIDTIWAEAPKFSNDNLIVFPLTILMICKSLYKPSGEDVVYFIRNSIGRVKIGFTRDIKERFKTLRNSSGDDLVIISMYSPTALEVHKLEAKLHQHFGYARLFGEWFNIDIPTEEIIKICKQLDN